MSLSERRWFGLAVVVVTAIAVAAIQRTTDLFQWPYLYTTATGAFVAISWIAWVQFRDGRDPALLFVSVGSGALALEVIVGNEIGHAVERAVILDHGSLGEGLAALAFYSALIAPLALAVCLVLAPPWRDRRGRPPIRATFVVATAAVALFAVDVAIVIIQPDSEGLFKTLAWAIVAISGVAIVRAYPRGGWYRWVAGSSAALMFAFGAWVVPSWDVLARSASSWIAVMPLTAALLLLAGVLATHRAQTSRMRRATDRAEEILGGRAEIASVIAHDVRSPVASMKSIAASTIANYERLDDAQRLEFVGMIDRQAEQVLGVVHQMSVALRVDARSLELVPRSTTIAAAAREAIDEARLDGHEVRLEAGPGITATVDGRWIAEAIRQAIDNAAAFSPEGAPIDVTVANGDGEVVVTVEDRGPGIPADRREALFDRFSRWRPPGYEDVPGSGLGLFICRGIVREHGGEVFLEDAPGGGTILRILLPWGTT